MMDFTTSSIEQLSQNLEWPSSGEEDWELGRMLRKVVEATILCQNDRHRTPLHVAATMKDLLRVQWLLRMGAKVNRVLKPPPSLVSGFSQGTISSYVVVGPRSMPKMIKVPHHFSVPVRQDQWRRYKSCSIGVSS